jgi:hypothetical protein
LRQLFADKKLRLAISLADDFSDFYSWAGMNMGGRSMAMPRL